MGGALPGSSLASIRSASAHLGSRLISALAQIDDMPEQTVRCPLDVTDFDDHLRAHPMDPAKHQRRTETATAWGRYRERHLLYPEWLKTLPQALQFGDGHAGPGSACIDELAL